MIIVYTTMICAKKLQLFLGIFKSVVVAVDESTDRFILSVPIPVSGIKLSKGIPFPVNFDLFHPLFTTNFTFLLSQHDVYFENLLWVYVLYFLGVKRTYDGLTTEVLYFIGDGVTGLVHPRDLEQFLRPIWQITLIKCSFCLVSAHDITSFNLDRCFAAPAPYRASDTRALLWTLTEAGARFILRW